MKKTVFNVGYGVEVLSYHCGKCGFNITNERQLNKAMNLLRENMKKSVKVVRIGDGLGIRFPNDFVKNFEIKQGKKITLTPEKQGVRMFFG